MDTDTVMGYLRPWEDVRSEIAGGPHGAFFAEWIPDWLTRTDSPTIEELWGLIDRAWDEDPPTNDEQFTRYYAHPVWWLNAKMEECDRISVEARMLAAKMARRYSPARALDRGGGYGLLLKMARDVLPDTQLELQDIANLEEARAHLAGLDRIRVVSVATPPYDLIWSTEVFEHLPDPIAEAFELNRLLRVGGILITTYSFFPMIKCHLKENFYLRSIFHRLLPFMGYRLAGFERPGVTIWAFEKTRDCSRARLRFLKMFLRCSKPLFQFGNLIYPLIRR